MILSILKDFTSIFTQMNWIVILLLSLGFLLCLIEAIVPGFGFFGITGIICEIAGVVVHAVISESFLQALLLVAVVVLITGLVFLIFLRSAKHGLLAKSAIVENKSTLPNDYKEKVDQELSKLIGLEGLALTDCRPVGKVRIGTSNYEAQAVGDMIMKDSVIKVVAIEDAYIMIDKITY